MITYVSSELSSKVRQLSEVREGAVRSNSSSISVGERYIFLTDGRGFGCLHPRRLSDEESENDIAEEFLVMATIIACASCPV